MKGNINIMLLDDEKLKRKKIFEEREELVVKSNLLIENTNFNLTEMEQKLIIYAISKVAKTDTELTPISVSVKDYCELTGISEKSGSSYNNIKKSLQNLRNKSWWIENENEIILFSWFDTARISKRSGIIEITLSKSLEPFLTQLKKSFTAYRLINILCLHSKHSIKIYELAKAHLYKHELDISVDELKRYLCIEEKYKEFKRLNLDVIKKSVDDINKNTDIDIEVLYLTKGKKVEQIHFNIIEKRGADKVIPLIENQQMALKDFY